MKKRFRLFTYCLVFVCARIAFRSSRGRRGEQWSSTVPTPWAAFRPRVRCTECRGAQRSGGTAVRACKEPCCARDPSEAVCGEARVEKTHHPSSCSGDVPGAAAAQSGNNGTTALLQRYRGRFDRTVVTALTQRSCGCDHSKVAGEDVHAGSLRVSPSRMSARPIDETRRSSRANVPVKDDPALATRHRQLLPNDSRNAGVCPCGRRVGTVAKGAYAAYPCSLRGTLLF